MSSSLLRPLSVLAVMLITAMAAVLAKPVQRAAADKPIIELRSVIPTSIAGWREDLSITPVLPPPELLAILDRTYDQVLTRSYRDAEGYRIMLSVAYGGAQHEGMNTHRPEICYPAQGFKLVSETQSHSIPTDVKPLPVRRLVAAQGSRNEPITYWLVVGDELTTFGFGHKLATLKHGLTGKIPDGMLVRVSSIDADNAEGFRRQERFIAQMIASLQPEHRQRFVGALP